MASEAVRVFRATVPPPYHVGVAFRVGSADESATERGLSHLVEHLALSTIGDVDHGFNGSVGASITTFVAQGSAAQMTEFLASLAAGLRELPGDRFEIERNVLRAEAAQRPPSVVGELLFWRFGLRSFGLSGIDELALHDATIDEARAWSERWFTAANAVVWIGGPDPDLVDIEALDLAVGAPRPSPPITPPTERLPGYAPSPVQGVHVGVLGPRRSGLGVAADILDERLRERLRHAEGLSYATAGSYEALTGDTAHLVFSADCRPDDSQQVCDLVLATLDGFATDGPTQAEIDRRHRRRVGTEDAMRPLGVAVVAALDALLDARLGSFEEQEAWMAALTPERVRDDFARAWESAFATLPVDVRVNGLDFLEARAWSEEDLEGRTFDASKALPGDLPRQQLTIADVGVTWRSGRDPWRTTVRFDECVAALAYSNGSRELLGVDGFRIRFVPEDWYSSAAIEAALRKAIPEDRWVEMLGDPPFRSQHPLVGGEPRGVVAKTRRHIAAPRFPTRAAVAVVAVLGLIRLVAAGSQEPADIDDVLRGLDRATEAGPLPPADDPTMPPTSLDEVCAASSALSETLVEDGFFSAVSHRIVALREVVEHGSEGSMRAAVHKAVTDLHVAAVRVQQQADPPESLTGPLRLMSLQCAEAGLS